MLCNIKNGQLASKSSINQVNTKNCEKFLNILWDEGFIFGYKKMNSHPEILKIFLKYKKKTPVIKSFKIISKSNFRTYYSIKQLWKLETIKGLLILSTNKGLLSINMCKTLKIGGEPIIIVK